ncbi:MAG: response regulator [Nitrospinota bacterium]
MDLDAFEGNLARIESALGLSRGDPEISGESSLPVVLVVDDDPAVLKTLQEVLGSRYRVKVFSGGEDLRSRWSGEGAAALLDIKMPKEGGLSVFRELRRQAPEMPIVFFSAHAGDEEVVSKARSISPAAFLGKGCSLSDLQNALREAIGRGAGPTREAKHV